MEQTKKGQYPRVSRVPADGDPSWRRIAAPILQLLCEGLKGWPQLRLFARERRMNANVLLNAVAWLANRGMATAYTKKGQTSWTASNLGWASLQVSPCLEITETPKSNRERGAWKGPDLRSLVDEVDGEADLGDEEDRGEDPGEKVGTHQKPVKKRRATR